MINWTWWLDTVVKPVAIFTNSNFGLITFGCLVLISIILGLTYRVPKDAGYGERVGVPVGILLAGTFVTPLGGLILLVILPAILLVMGMLVCGFGIYKFVQRLKGN